MCFVYMTASGAVPLHYLFFEELCFSFHLLLFQTIFKEIDLIIFLKMAKETFSSLIDLFKTSSSNTVSNLACEICGSKLSVFRKKVSIFPMNLLSMYSSTVVFFGFYSLIAFIFAHFTKFFSLCQKPCLECKKQFCSQCLLRGRDRTLHCKNCYILCMRPPLRSALLNLRVKDLQHYLNQHNVSTRGCLGIFVFLLYIDFTYDGSHMFLSYSYVNL